MNRTDKDFKNKNIELKIVMYRNNDTIKTLAPKLEYQTKVYPINLIIGLNLKQVK